MPSLQRLEKLLGILLPPATREHVLGDLHETCRSPRQYIVSAISVLGPVVISRIRRTTDFQVVLMEVFAIYMSLVVAAWSLAQRSFLYDEAGFARLAIPTTVTTIGLLLCNAYADPAEGSSNVRPALQSGGSLTIAFGGQALLFDTWPSLAIPFWIMLYGSCASLVLVSTLRALFPPILDKQPITALANDAKVLRKAAPPKAQSAPRWKAMMILAVVLLAAGLLLRPKPREVLIALLLILSCFALYQLLSRD